MKHSLFPPLISLLVKLGANFDLISYAVRMKLDTWCGWNVLGEEGLEGLWRFVPNSLCDKWVKQTQEPGELPRVAHH